jgi:exopolysaccharide biosynthesis polyprenyl glycosylphosphotransferase
VSATDTQKAIPFPVTSGLAAALARLCFPAAFLFVDSGMLIAAATVAHWLPGTADEPFWQGFLPGTRFVYPLVFWLVSLVALQVFGFYDRLRTVLRNSELADLYAASTAGIVVTMAVTLLVSKESTPAVYILTWVAAPPAIAVGRGLLRRLRRQLCPTSTLSVPLLLIPGQGEESGRLLRRIESVPELDFLPIEVGGSALGNLQEVRQFVQENSIRHVIIAPSQENQDLLGQMADYCQENGLRVAWLQRTTGLPMAISSLRAWDGTPVIHFSEPITQRFYETGKRALDLACALLVFPFLLPLLFLITVAIRLDSPGPVFVVQRRAGRGGRMFDMYKFRSMRTVGDEIPEDLLARNEATGPLFKMREDPRITRIGRLLRRTSLDEVPQVFNVLRGEMSLVGPRPPLPREIPGYDVLQRRRLAVKPGITGLWQVSGRSSLTFEEMLRLDVRYIQKRSLLLDIIILLKTVPCVISGKGAY